MTVHEHREQAAADIINHLYAAVRRHVGKEKLDDDITVVIVKVGPTAS